MYPEQQTPQQGNDYDFILESNLGPDKKPFGQRINKKAVVIAVAILFGLITVGLISWFDSQAKAAEEQMQRLVEIAQMQTEISRVATIGTEKSEKDKTRERAEAIKSSLDDSRKTTLELLKERGVTPDKKILDALADKKVDSELDKTVEFGGFDKSFEKIIDGQILIYQRLILEASKNGNAYESAILQKMYEDANSMLGLVDRNPNEPQETDNEEQSEESSEGEDEGDGSGDNDDSQNLNEAGDEESL